MELIEVMSICYLSMYVLDPHLPLLHEVQVGHANFFSPTAVGKFSSHSYLLLLRFKKYMAPAANLGKVCSQHYVCSQHFAPKLQILRNLDAEFRKDSQPAWLADSVTSLPILM